MVKLELDGKEIELSITMKGLYLLRKKDPDAYERYYSAEKTIGNGKSTMLFDAVQIAYTGYLCALIKSDEYDGHMSYEEFMDYLPEGVNKTILIARELSSPKKAKGSAKLSEAPRESESNAV